MVAPTLSLNLNSKALVQLSMWGLYAAPEMTAYNMTKSSVLALSETLASGL